MFSPRAASSDNLAKSSKAVFTTYSLPSTPLPAALTTFSAQGSNWSSADAMDNSTEFPWHFSTLTPVTPSSTGESDVLLTSNSSNYVYSEATTTPVDAYGPTSPLSHKTSSTSQLNGTPGRRDESQSIILKTNFKLQLPPLNQKALLEAALSSRSILRSSDEVATTDFRSINCISHVRSTPEASSSAKIVGAESGQTSQSVSTIRDIGSLQKRFETYNSAVGMDHAVVGDRLFNQASTLALLTPPDENRDFRSVQASNDAQHVGLSLSSTSAINQSSLVAANDVSDSSIGLDTTKHLACDVETTQNAKRQELEATLVQGLNKGSMWLKDVLITLFLNSKMAGRHPYEAIRMVSQSLPCPLPPQKNTSAREDADLPLSASEAPVIAANVGYFFPPPVVKSKGSTSSHIKRKDSAHEGTTTALQTYTKVIQQAYKEDEKPVFIHVSHAIPVNIPLSRLPSQPLTDSSVPSITSSMSGNLCSSLFGNHNGKDCADSYPNPTIFNSIVIAQDFTKKTSRLSKARPAVRPSPSPILPPFSLHYSLLDRYIPPPDTSSDVNLFSASSSPLVNRIFELTTDGGCLLFIYPTKTGAKQFCTNYLGPVLDPLLRRLMVLHRLKDDLLWNISRMVAADNMQEFEGLEKRLKKFCDQLSKKDAETAHEISPAITVSLIHSQKLQVQLDPHSWREWWAQQEQGRIRELVKEYYARISGEEQELTREHANMRMPSHYTSQNSVSFADATIASIPQYNVPSDLVREIIEGVKAFTKRPSSRGMGEAMVASSLVGPVNAWSVIGESRCHSPVPPIDNEEEEGIELGVFVLQRTG